MNRKTTLAALSAALMVSASSMAVKAEDMKRPDHHPDMGMHHACGPNPMMMMHNPAGLFIFALQQLDTNHDGRIAKDEVKDAENKLFAAIDTNHDGVITPSELKTYRDSRMQAFHAAMKAEHEKQAASNDNKDDKRFAPCDGPKGEHADWKGGPQNHGPQDHGPQDHGPDGPGPHHHHKHHGEGEFGLMRLFAMVDTDGSGQISKAEADAAVDKLFDRFDTNKDGYISADDFPKAPSILPDASAPAAK